MAKRRRGFPPALEKSPPGSAASREPSKSEITTSLEYQRFFSGPLPSPETLAGYEAVCPGCGDRIITMAEKEGEHRREIQRDVIRANILFERRAQILSAIIVLAFGAGGIYLIATGKSINGLVALLTPLVGLAGLFYASLRQQKKNEESEQQEP